MDERHIATSVLLMSKQLAKAYAGARLEAAHHEGHELLGELGEEVFRLHYDVWAFMDERGWYSTTSASEEMVQQALQAWGEPPTS